MHGKPSRADRSNFAVWLNADDANRQTYDEISLMWSSAEMSGSQVAREEAAALKKHLEHIRRKRKMGKRASFIAGCLAVLFGGSWVWLERPHILQDMRADYVTARGERRSLSLEDGSTVLLDADTAVDVEIDAHARRIRLLRGTAFFTVEPSTVPFVVMAGDGKSRVLGTAFDVSVVENDVSVTLERGSLQVTVAGDGVVLKPGEGVAYNGAGIGKVQKVDLDENMAWHQGRYVFTNARLADVMGYIERYRDGRIVVFGDALGDRRISGSFSVEDTDAALASLQATVGFKLNRLSGRVVIIRQ
jgi:transmembrane sensor